MEDRILIVDDDVSIRNLFISFFSNAGYSIYGAEADDEALEVLEQKYFHLIFLDLNLPGMDGIQLCRKIREISPVATIIAITGYGPIFDSDACKDAGFNYYFKKPLRLEKLLNIAKKVFENQED